MRHNHHAEPFLSRDAHKFTACYGLYAPFTRSIRRFPEGVYQLDLAVDEMDDIESPDD